MHLDYTKVIILILWWRNFQLEYWRTFQLVSTSIDEVIKEIDEERVREKEVDKRIASQRDTMTPEERERQDEADRVVFERWQDEANTNLYLTGVVDEDEDPDFNPFRKNND